MTYLEAPVHLASSDGSGVVGTIAACISSIGSGLNVWCPGDVHRVELQQPSLAAAAPAVDCYSSSSYRV